MKDSTQAKTARDAILDATDRLLAKQGFKKMTIDDLAAEVGIGKGSVYLHFESKEEIALAHIDRIIQRLHQNLDEIALSDDRIESKLRAMIMERVLFRFDGVQHYAQSLNELLANLRPRLLERRKRSFGEEAEIFSRVLEEGQRVNLFEFDDAMMTALAVLDATNALLPYSLSAYELGERWEIEEKTHRVADLILSGLLTR